MADDYSREFAALDRDSNQLDDSPDAAYPKLPPPTPVTAPQDSNDRKPQGGGPLYPIPNYITGSDRGTQPVPGYDPRTDKGIQPIPNSSGGGWQRVIGSEFGETDRYTHPLTGPDASWDRGAWGDPLSGWSTQGVALRGVPRGTQVALRNPETGATVVTTVKDKGPGESTGASVDMLAGTRASLGFSLNYKGPVDVQIVGGPQFSFEKESPTSVAATNRNAGGDDATLEEYRQKYYSQIDKETFNKLADQPGGKKPLDDYVYEKAPPPERLKIKFPQYKDQSDEDAVKNVWNDLGPQEQKKLGTFKDFHDKMFPPGPLDKVIKDLKHFWPNGLHALKAGADFGTAELMKVIPGAYQAAENFNNQLDKLVGIDKREMPGWSKPLENLFAQLVQGIQDQAKGYEQRAQKGMPNPQSPVGQVETGIAGGVGQLPAASLPWLLGGGEPAAAIVAAEAFASNSKYSDLVDGGYKNAIPELLLTEGSTGLMGYLFNSGAGRALMSLSNAAMGEASRGVQDWIDGKPGTPLARHGAMVATDLFLGAFMAHGKGKLPEEVQNELEQASKAQEQGEHEKAREHVDRAMSLLPNTPTQMLGQMRERERGYLPKTSTQMLRELPEGPYTLSKAGVANQIKKTIEFIKEKNPAEKPGLSTPQEPVDPGAAYFYSGLPVRPDQIEATIRDFLRTTRINKLGEAFKQTFDIGGGEGRELTRAVVRQEQARTEWGKAKGDVLFRDQIEEAKKSGEFQRLKLRDKFRFDRFDNREHEWSKFSIGEKTKFLSQHLQGKSTGNPKVDFLLKMYDPVYKYLGEKELRYGIKHNMLEHYVPGMFENDQEFNRFKNWLQKTYPDFVHPKQFYDFQIAAQKGFKLKGEASPERLYQMRHRASDKAVQKVNELNRLEAFGKAFDTKKNVPEDAKEWVVRPSPNGKNYHVAPDSDVVLKNVWDTPGELARAWTDAPVGFLKFMKGLSTPFRFAASLYHNFHVSTIFESEEGRLNPKFSRRARALLPLLGIPDSVSAVRNHGGIVDLAQGTLKWEDATNEQHDEARLLSEMGLVLKPNEERELDWLKGTEALAKANSVIGTGFGFLTMRPIMKYMFGKVITSTKANMALLLHDKAVQKMPWLTNPENLKEYTILKTKLGQLVDTRAGEMHMPNLLWNQIAKNVGIGMFQSLGWNLSLYRIYNVPRDLWTNGKHMARVAQKLKETNYDKAEAWLARERLKFAAHYTARGLMYGGLISALGCSIWNSAHPDPKDHVEMPFEKGLWPGMWDCLFPRIGKWADGSPIRLNTMFFLRDFASWLYHKDREGISLGSWNFLANKFSAGMDWMVHAIAQNKDFMGRQIRDEHADFFTKQLPQITGYTLGSFFTPFSFQALQQPGVMSVDTNAPLVHVKDPFRAVAAFLGFQAAPKYTERSPTENEVMRLMGSKVGQMTPEEGQVYDARNALRDAMESQDKDAIQKAEQTIRDMGKAAGEDHKKTEGRIKKIKEKASTPKAMLDFNFLKEDERNRLLNKMSPEERAEWLKHISPKARREYERSKARTGAAAPLEK